MPLSAFQPEQYASLLATKVAGLQPLFTALGAPESRVFRSPESGFRLRAEFRVWHSGDALDYVMFRRGEPKTPLPVSRFPIAADAIQALMPDLLDELKANELLRKKLFQVEFLSTLAGDMLVTLIYHRPLDETWQDAARGLASKLGIRLVGRSRRQKLTLDRDWVEERLTVAERAYRYRQPEQAFTQPNGAVNEQMLAWACDAATHCRGNLLELYCGIGNFTLPLAARFDRVIATELSKVATAAAEHNRVWNQIENIEFARLSAEDMTSALRGDRAFRRLAHLERELSDYGLQTLFVDPPRAGLDADTLALARGFPDILYVSCNPETLLNNLRALSDTHRIEQLAFFDQFPYTDHMECGVRLRHL